MAGALLVWPFVLSGVRRGLSGAATLRSLRRSGYTIGNAAFGELFRRATLQESLNSKLKFIRRDFFPNPRRLAEAITKQTRQFVFTVRIRGRNPVTGVKGERFVNVALDNLMTRGEIEALAQASIGRGVDSPGLDDPTLTLVGGTRKGVFGTLL